MEDISLGIAIDVSDPARAGSTLSLALQAESENFDLVVLTVGDRQDSTVVGLDVGTVANWLLGSTRRIAVGISVPGPVRTDVSDGLLPDMAAKAQATSNILASGRLITAESSWVLTAPDEGLSIVWSERAGRSSYRFAIPAICVESQRFGACWTGERAPHSAGPWRRGRCDGQA